MKVREIYTILTNNNDIKFSVPDIAKEMMKADDINDMTRNCLGLIDYTVTDFNILEKVSKGKKLYSYYPAIDSEYPKNYILVCPIIDGSILIEN